MVLELLSLQTCITAGLSPWQPLPICVLGGWAGAGDGHVDDLYSEPVVQAPDRACFLQDSWGARRWGDAERGGGEARPAPPHPH